MACRWTGSPGGSASGGTWFGRGSTAIARTGSTACGTVPAQGGRGRFPPEVVLRLVDRACELPEQAGRSLSQWDCAELARQLVRDEVVASISPQTVQRMLAADRL